MSMKNVKANVNLKLEGKGVIALVIVIVLILAGFLFFVLSDTQGSAPQGVANGGTSGAVAEQNPSAQANATYVGNLSTRLFHYPDCRYTSQLAERNAVYFSSLAETAGYSPCSVCMPG